jgi:hypothetical protein
LAKLGLVNRVDARLKKEAALHRHCRRLSFCFHPCPRPPLGNHWQSKRALSLGPTPRWPCKIYAECAREALRARRKDSADVYFAGGAQGSSAGYAAFKSGKLVRTVEFSSGVILPAVPNVLVRGRPSIYRPTITQTGVDMASPVLLGHLLKKPASQCVSIVSINPAHYCNLEDSISADSSGESELPSTPMVHGGREGEEVPESFVIVNWPEHSVGSRPAIAILQVRAADTGLLGAGSRH